MLRPDFQNAHEARSDPGRQGMKLIMFETLSVPGTLVLTGHVATQTERARDAVHARDAVDLAGNEVASKSSALGHYTTVTRWLIASCTLHGNWRTLALAHKVSLCMYTVYGGGAGSGLGCLLLEQTCARTLLLSTRISP